MADKQGKAPDAKQRLEERRVFDRWAIDQYAVNLTAGVVREALETNQDPMPDEGETLAQSVLALESFYDKSLTIERLHDQVRTSNNHFQLQAFLDDVPACVMRDMSIAATGEEDRQRKKREELIKFLDYVVKLHLQTATATISLLSRFEKMEDDEVKHVKKLVTDSRKKLLDKHEACKKAGVFKEED